MSAAFDQYIRLREYYLEQKDPEATFTMENLIKNHLGVRRLRDDYPELFINQNEGREVEFHQGKFLGWGDEVVYDPNLKGVVAYEI